MPRIVTSPPLAPPSADGSCPGGWWHDDPDTGRIVCDLCPRACVLKPGDRGFCFVRRNVDDALVLTTFGRSTGFCVDPIEKKPLNHFLPGTSVLSFGTAGCNLGCQFCQNWDISKSREVARLSEEAMPEAIAAAAIEHGCSSVAFTYNDPVVWAEYAIETAKACRAVGIKTVAVTAGYITPEARGAFFEFMDAANVDLKGFTEEFYRKITYSHLRPVLDTLAWLKAETEVWFEITNLLIPGANDDLDQIKAMCGWILEHCGDEVPVHFTAFHPDFRMRDRGGTPIETLLSAHRIGKEEGLKHVYTGNVDDVRHQSTYCPNCGELVIERNWYELGAYRLRGDLCASCGGRVAGRFGGRPGNWGRKRLPIVISRSEMPGENVPGVVNIGLGNLSSPPQDKTHQGKRPMNPEPCVEPMLDDAQRETIHKATCALVAAAIQNRPARPEDATLEGANGLMVEGAYVTLKRSGQLRACCGSLGAARPMAEALAGAAYHTAKDDYRLPPISVSELPFLDLDVNLLHGLAPVSAQGRDRIGAVEVGRHGLRVTRGGVSGLLLPSVAVERGWDSEAFLRHACRKAGLPAVAWEDDDVVLHTFEAVAFGGPFDGSVIAKTEPERFTADGLQHIASMARQNMVAYLTGLTPNFYLPGVPDWNVSGLALTVEIPGRPEPLSVAQFSLRPPLPFQATLFTLSQTAADTMARLNRVPGVFRVGFTVFTDPAMHGSIAEPDLRGVDPATRALFALENDRSAWAFDPSKTPEELLDIVAERLHVLDRGRASLFSLSAQSTEPSVVFGRVAKAVGAGGTRLAAQAGRFYPADADELNKLVGSCLESSARDPGSWPAAMVPHAGLAYSGKIAGSVFQRLEIPGTVIVIGPKHTRLGVDWAVAPNQEWALPGGSLKSDVELAHKLAESIPGLELDAAAHEHEHAIEVELAFLRQLAPETKVVGISLGAGNWELCQRFAKGLADVIRDMPSRPLLLVSSDMNHFAADAENRRLDEIALQAMETLDPEALLKTVTDQEISMCGVVPAVIVMETLRQLDGLSRCERVAYGTSADASGDTSRVVGYAGLLLG